MGRALERRRCEFLPEMATARRVLILGEGDGRFLTLLLQANQGVEIDVVDNSAKMLARAERRACATVETNASKVRFHHADARLWIPPAETNYDLVVTHFFLDCFEESELAPMVRQFAAGEKECRWIVSEFRQPASGFSAWRARLWIGTLYRLFGWTTGLRVRRLPDYGFILKQCGFRRIETVISEWGLLTSELWERP